MKVKTACPARVPASRGAREDGPSTGTMRVGPIAAIPAVLAAAGVDPVELLAEFGLEPELFSEPESLIALPTVGALLHRCVERTQCPHFGLLVGRCASISAMGVLGYLMQASPTVGVALRALDEHLHAHDRSAVVTLTTTGDLASLSYSIVVSGIDGVTQINDTAIAIGLNLLRALCGPTWHLTAVQLAHARPGKLEPYVRHFGVAPHFDSECNALIFDKRWLDQPTHTADPVLYRMMLDRINEFRAHRHEDLAEQIRRILTRRVGTPECTLGVVATELGMGGRTLNRRLAISGSTFRDLREEVHLQAACQLLQDTRLSALEIAQILGYSDGTAFSRAFTRWAGVGPIQWRRSATEQAAKAAPSGKSA